MLIQLKDILRNPLFHDIRILSGQDGLCKPVKRISVFDCLCSKDLIELGILSAGDVFITDLTQFLHNKENIPLYITTLIQTKSSGLFVVTDEMLYVLSPDILAQCDQNNFPIVLIPNNYPYAQIIDVVSRYLAADNSNTINYLKLERIMRGQLSDREKLNTLSSINPNIQSYLRVIAAHGDPMFDSTNFELEFYYSKQSHDIYVKMDNTMIFILSSETEKGLRHYSDSTASRLKQFIRDPILGYSMIYTKDKIDLALNEALKALNVAETLHISCVTYNSLSVLQLVLGLKDCKEAHDFYQSYVEAIRLKFSSESACDALHTIETFVANKGSYSETAKALSQHENTIRYRVNRVKEALGLESDNICFHETIALAVKLRMILDSPLL